MLLTSHADDDWDGMADFYDLQVLAAMYAPELDGVDNDGDGAVDEMGERYIAAFDDDEDGRYDEDPPDFQLALNLMDYIDDFMPYVVSEDPDVQAILGKSAEDPVLSDPVTIRTFNLFSSRNRAYRMHPRLLIGPNQNSREEPVFVEYMRLMMPNPPLTGMPTRFEGVESIRINEVFASRSSGWRRKRRWSRWCIIPPLPMFRPPSCRLGEDLKPSVGIPTMDG